MIKSNLALLAVVAAYQPVAVAQQSGWTEPNQVNATMCFWSLLRASVIKDTLYMDGGDLNWIPGLSNGEYGTIAPDLNPRGLVYTLNFSVPFNTTRNQNISAILKTISKAPNGGAANNIAPNYMDGAMLGNDAEWFLFGGLLDKTDAYSPPYQDQLTEYMAYQYGANKPAFSPGFLNAQLPSGMTRYLAYGGAASAPSENKAWYFSGLRAPGFGPIYTVNGNDSETAINVSSTLITLDMGTQQQEKWSNASLPEYISGRANPELVWVPVGAQGILVALGGVIFPNWVSVSQKSKNEQASEAQSPKFMSTIDIYDIANDKWYQQPASGSPPQLTRGCAVVATAQDASSYNIYYYGGYDGIHPADAYNDDVWILSLPSFMWMKVYSSQKPSHGRAGHQCVKPYPDQMFVVGGYPSLGGNSPTCLGDNVIQVFNLTSGKWLSSYDPAVWSEYGVPEMIFNMIGGTATGGATVTTPSPTGWATPALASVFATKYPTSKIPVSYPYSSGGPNGTRPDLTSSSGSSGGIPSWVPPVLGVICGLMFLSAIGVAILLYRRRRLLRAGTASEAGTDENGNRIFSWLRAQGSENKAPTVTTTTEDTPLSPEMETRSPIMQPLVHHEMADTQVAELPDTSPRVELQDTGLTPVEIINKHSHFGQNPSSVHNTSQYSSVNQTDHASFVSRSSGAARGSGPAGSVSPTGYVDHSPALGTPTREGGSPLVSTAAAAAAAGGGGAAAMGVSARGESGVSGLSERDRAHLRQISDTTVSSVNTARDDAGGAGSSSNRAPLAPVPDNSPVTPSAGGTLGPISPPTPHSAEAEDYLGAGSAAARRGQSASPAGPASSPLRRSVFFEHREDMGGPG